METLPAAEILAAAITLPSSVVPPAVPGVVFLSGGQDDVPATQNLNSINQIDNVPWELSFSYGRALQSAALKAWHGSDVRAGQQALLHRADCNGAARYGYYSEAMEQGTEQTQPEIITLPR